MTGAPNDISAPGNSVMIHSLPASNPAGTSDTVALPVQGVTGGIALPVSAASLPLPAGAAQDGTDATGVTPPTGAVGIRGWLSGIYSKLAGSLAVTGTFWQATQPVSAASLPLPTGAAQDGTDATGVTAPTGAVGIRGWLSGILQQTRRPAGGHGCVLAGDATGLCRVASSSNRCRDGRESTRATPSRHKRDRFDHRAHDHGHRDAARYIERRLYCR